MDHNVKCQLCVFEARSIPLVLSHLRSVHSSDPGFNVTCGVQGCARTFTRFSTLYQHIYRHHNVPGIVEPRKKKFLVDSQTPDESSIAASVDHADHGLNHGGHMDFNCNDNNHGNYSNPDLDHLLGIDVRKMKRAGALFLMKLKEIHHLPQTAIDDIVEGYSNLMTFQIAWLHSAVRAKLSELAVEEDACDDIFTDIIHPFDGLRTRTQQENYIKKEFNLVEPQEIFIGEPYYPARLSGSKRCLVEKRDSFQYISLLESLKVLLQDKTILEFIDHPNHRNDEVIEDFCDGERFQNHPLFSNDPHALQIIGYVDELELCNPLGTHTKRHKLLIILFGLGNIPSKYRSTLKTISLVACATHPVVTKHGLDSILEPFVKDLHTLATQGIEVNIDGTQRTFKGALLCILGDNPASNAVGGFKESFSLAFRFCRTCMATNNNFRDHFSLDAFTKRTDTVHEHHCSQIQGPLKDHNSKTYGINRRTILLNLPDFSLFGGLPHDLMHDLFEGLAQHEIKLLLKYCVDAKYLTITQYNHRVTFFDYGRNENDKPGIITRDMLQSNDRKLNLSASQCLLLCRILPLLIGELVPENDNHWKCYILLLKIISIMISQVVSEGQCASLALLIKEHHSLFKQLYSESAILPKSHFLIHYPEQILALGPLVRTWTIRYEAKLSLFKKASRVGNFKNIALTLSQRHQYWMCYQLASGQLLQQGFECGPGDHSPLLMYKEKALQDKIYDILPGISNETPVFNTHWVKKYGILYHNNNCFVLQGSDGLNPVFGKIIDIFVLGGDLVLLHLQCYHTRYYDEHFHSFVVYPTPNTSIVNCEQLDNWYVLNSHKLFDGSSEVYIALKHAFVA